MMAAARATPTTNHIQSSSATGVGICSGSCGYTEIVMLLFSVGAPHLAHFRKPRNMVRAKSLLPHFLQVGRVYMSDV